MNPARGIPAMRDQSGEYGAMVVDTSDLPVTQSGEQLRHRAPDLGFAPNHFQTFPVRRFSALS